MVSPITFLPQVLHWMEDAGIQPTNGMYHDISTYAEKSGGHDYAAIIKERIGIHYLNAVPLIIQLFCRYLAKKKKLFFR